MSYNLSLNSRPVYPVRSLLNLLRMGHCAPTVVQTILQITHNEQEWLVKLTAGLPGGIGNTQGECDGMTSPLIILGLRYGLDEMRDGLPALFDHGHAYCQRFSKKNAAMSCKEIQGRCFQAIVHAPGLLADTQTTDNRNAIPSEQRTAYSRLYAHMQEQSFHCAQAVLQHLDHTLPVTPELPRAASAFLGGTLFQGQTCSAFTCGVMVIGLRCSLIEKSYLRVIRMLAKGVDISDESANQFHRTINLGQRLSERFVARYGSTQCRAITGCDFATVTGVENYIAVHGTTTCKQIASWVANQVHTIFAELESGEMVG